MAQFQIAMNVLFRNYQNDPAKVARLMELDRIVSYSDVFDMLYGLQKEITELMSALDEERKEKECPKAVTQIKSATVMADSPYRRLPKKPSKYGTAPAMLREKKRISAARAELRERGYVIGRGSLVAYWDKTTERNMKWERHNSYGFRFEKKKEQ